MQIRTRLTIYFVSITASILLFSFTLVYLLSTNERKNHFSTRLYDRAITKADLLIKYKTIHSDLLEEIDNYRRDILTGEEIIIANKQKKIVYSSSQNTLSPYKIKSIIQTTLQKGKFQDENNGKITIAKIYHHKHSKFILIASAVDTYGQKNLYNLKNNLLNVFINTVTLLGILGWIFAKKALEPITKIMNQVDHISADNLSVRLNENDKKKDEIERLTRTFNLLLERLEKAFQTQRQFISHASHELLNPLSSITSQIEVTLLTDRSSETYKKTLESIHEDMIQLNDLSRQLMLLSKNMETQNRVNFREHNIHLIILECQLDFKKHHPDAHFNYDFSELDDSTYSITCNETLMRTCFNNLIDNAYKFSSDKTINIRIAHINHEIQLVVSNIGKIIPKEDIQHLFSPFYRSKENQTKKGYTIGLSIVKSIIDLHQFSIEIVSNNSSDTRFIITMH